MIFLTAQAAINTHKLSKSICIRYLLINFGNKPAR